LVGFLVHWTVLSVVAAWRLYDAGLRQPTVARRRMHMLALAVAAITIAIFLAAASSARYSGVALATGIIAFLSEIALLPGLATSSRSTCRAGRSSSGRRRTRRSSGTRSSRSCARSGA